MGFTGRGAVAHGGDGSTASPDTGKSFDSLYAVNPQQALVIEAQKMKTFKKRVDDLLIALDGSEAAPARMGGGRMSRGQLGAAEFGEAQFLYESYTVVHDELEKLSKALGAQIEGMGLAVHSSRVGYDNVDQDIRDRMKAINAEVEALYDRDRDPDVEVAPKEKKADKEAGF
jgi:hypothetical protein